METRIPVDLLLTDGLVLTMDSARRLIEHGAVAVSGGRILEVGDSRDLEARYDAEKVIRAGGKLIMPGLINAHTHILQTLLRGGLSQDREVYDWMVNVLYPGLWQYTPRQADVATRLYATEAIRAGTTTLVENCDNGRADELSSAAIGALADSGLRAMFARLFYDVMPADLGNALQVVAQRAPGVRREQRLEEDTADAIAHTADLMRRFDGIADGRIRVWPAPALPHTTSDEALGRAFELAAEHDTMVSIHVAESPRDAMNGGLMSSVEHLAARGGLNERLLAAHCVWLGDRDMRLMAAANANVAHNPVSNLYLASGIAPVARMVGYGLNVSIGTDDANCNESASMIQEMKFAALLQRGKQLDSSAVTTEKVVEMATVDAARAVGMAGQIGSLEAGFKADLIVLDLDVPQLTPLHHVPNGLVFQAYGSEVVTTIVDGRVLMEDRALTGMSPEEEQELRAEAQAASGEIARAAGLELHRDWRTVGV